MGCGGAVARCTIGGGTAHLVIVTGGEAGPTEHDEPTFRRQRAGEQATAAARLNASHVFLSHPDLAVEANGLLVGELDLQIRDFQPEVIFAPWPNDTHQDHRAVALAAMSAARNATQLLFYATPTSVAFEPTIYSDISDVIESKIEALHAHDSQVTQSARVEPDVILANARVLGARAGCHYAEGFIAYRLLLGKPVTYDTNTAIADRLAVPNWA